jgi:hypothetical protein
MCLVAGNALAVGWIVKMSMDSAQAPPTQLAKPETGYQISACYKNDSAYPEAFIIDRQTGRTFHLKSSTVRDNKIAWECQEMMPKIEAGPCTEGLTYTNYQDHVRLLEERLRDQPRR